VPTGGISSRRRGIPMAVYGENLVAADSPGRDGTVGISWDGEPVRRGLRRSWLQCDYGGPALGWRWRGCSRGRSRAEREWVAVVY
jgi:hypothetical protein